MVNLALYTYFQKTEFPNFSSSRYSI